MLKSAATTSVESMSATRPCPAAYQQRTAGIGESSAEMRKRIFSGLAHMGMILDEDRNQVEGAIGVNRIISIDDSPIKICVVTTDEEMRIARETAALLQLV